jgi:hypothetical protein
MGGLSNPSEKICPACPVGVTSQQLHWRLALPRPDTCIVILLLSRTHGTAADALRPRLSVSTKGKGGWGSAGVRRTRFG